MTRFACTKGCKPPFGAKNRYHETAADCDNDTSYDKTRPKACNCRGLKSAPAPAAAPAPPPAAETPPPEKRPVGRPPGSGSLQRLEVSDRQAEIVPTKRIILPPVSAEFTVDAEHTIAAWNFGFEGIYFVHVQVDDWYEWKAHLPRSQFALTDLAEQTIRVDLKNFYTKAVNTVCRWVGCRTQQQAHAAIDTALFFRAFGGIGIALLLHYKKVYKDSPKLIRNREKKKVAEEARRLARTGAMDTTAREVSMAAAAAAA